MTIAHDTYIAAIKQDWDVWREHYDYFTIDDLIWLNTAVSRHFGIQRYHNTDLINEVLDAIPEPKTIMELGCYRGYSAAEILERRKDIKYWIGYDINYHSITETVVKDSKYVGVKLTNWLHTRPLFVPPANTFLSSHTLEHFNEHQLNTTIKYLADNNVKYAIIEMPFSNRDRAWKGYNGSHVYPGDKQEFLHLMESCNYSVMIELEHNVFGFNLNKTKEV